MRSRDWPQRLVAFIESRRGMPFEWGGNDCLSFVADAIVAMGGEDYLSDRRGAWSSEEGARALIAGEGGLEAVLDARFSRTDRPQRGDIGLLNEHTMALVYPPHAVLPGEKHIRMLPLRICKVFWSV